MGNEIAGPGAGREHLTREGCWIRELLNDATNPEVSLAEARVEPGITTELHALAVTEWYLIRAGRGLMQLGDAPAFRVAAGDTVRIAAGRAQRIENDGDCDLRFLCLCVPRFTPAAYDTLD